MLCRFDMLEEGRGQVGIRLTFIFLCCCGQLLLTNTTRQNRRRSTPDYLIELYHKFNSGSGDLDEEEQDANKIYTIYPTGESEETAGYLPQKSKLKFNVSSLKEEDRVIGAHLRIYVERLIAHPADDSQETTDDDHHEEGKASKRSGGREVALIIKTTCTTMIKKISDGAISFGTRWRHTKLLTKAETGRWTKLKVTSAERTLNNLRRYREIFHFDVWCALTAYKPKASAWNFQSADHDNLMPILSGQSDKEPSLVVYVSNNETRPFRKMVEMNQKDRNLVARDLKSGYDDPDEGGMRHSRNYYQNRGCHHQDFHLVFRKIGWDSRILYPSEMNIRRCVGRCPFPMSNNIAHSTHAFMQATWNARFPEEITSPCCVARGYRMDSLILHGSGADVYIKPFEDMVITSCHCG